MTRNKGSRFISRIPKLAWGIWLACALGCYGTSNRDGSGETHFLSRCDDCDKCADGLQCICGVCTIPCDESNQCKAQNEHAKCMPSDCSKERICDIECVDDDDCVELGPHSDCQKGRCRAVGAETGDAATNDRGTRDGGVTDRNSGQTDSSQADSSQTDSSQQTEEPEPGEPNCVELTEPRRFVVDGAVVWTRIALNELPETVTEVELSGTVIDSGNGPEVCLGGIDESLPPQCKGPVVEGLQMGSWTESFSGVTWGERTMIVEWPPLQGRLRLISDRDYEVPCQRERERFELPSECSSIYRLTSVDVLNQWALDHPDQAGLVYVLPDQHSGVLGVTGNPETVRAELRADGVEPCVIEVDYSTSELEAAQKALDSLFSSDAFIESTGIPGIENRVNVGVVVADASTVRKIVAMVNDPGILLIEGRGFILDGE